MVYHQHFAFNDLIVSYIRAECAELYQAVSTRMPLMFLRSCPSIICSSNISPELKCSHLYPLQGQLSNVSLEITEGEVEMDEVFENHRSRSCRVIHNYKGTRRRLFRDIGRRFCVLSCFLERMMMIKLCEVNMDELNELPFWINGNLSTFIG